MTRDNVVYSFDGELFHLQMRGEYTPDDIRRVFLEALADPALPRTPLLIFDVTQSRALGKRTPEDLRQMARFLAENTGAMGRQFAIAAGPDLHYGMMRMAQVFSEMNGAEVQVFRSFEEARAWVLTGGGPSAGQAVDA